MPDQARTWTTYFFIITMFIYKFPKNCSIIQLWKIFYPSLCLTKFGLLLLIFYQSNLFLLKFKDIFRINSNSFWWFASSVQSTLSGACQNFFHKCKYFDNDFSLFKFEKIKKKIPTDWASCYPSRDFFSIFLSWNIKIDSKIMHWENFFTEFCYANLTTMPIFLNDWKKANK